MPLPEPLTLYGPTSVGALGHAVDGAMPYVKAVPTNFDLHIVLTENASSRTNWFMFEVELPVVPVAGIVRVSRGVGAGTPLALLDILPGETGHVQFTDGAWKAAGPAAPDRFRDSPLLLRAGDPVQLPLDCQPATVLRLANPSVAAHCTLTLPPGVPDTNRIWTLTAVAGEGTDGSDIGYRDVSIEAPSQPTVKIRRGQSVSVSVDRETRSWKIAVSSPERCLHTYLGDQAALYPVPARSELVVTPESPEVHHVTVLNSSASNQPRVVLPRPTKVLPGRVFEVVHLGCETARPWTLRVDCSGDASDGTFRRPNGEPSSYWLLAPGDRARFVRVGTQWTIEAWGGAIREVPCAHAGGLSLDPGSPDPAAAGRVLVAASVRLPSLDFAASRTLVVKNTSNDPISVTQGTPTVGAAVTVDPSHAATFVGVHGANPTWTKVSVVHEP